MKLFSLLIGLMIVGFASNSQAATGSAYCENEAAVALYSKCSLTVADTSASRLNTLVSVYALSDNTCNIASQLADFNALTYKPKNYTLTTYQANCKLSVGFTTESDYWGSNFSRGLCYMNWAYQYNTNDTFSWAWVEVCEAE